MADERIDPFRLENRYAVDHLHRYFLLRSLVKEKRVLDAACGTGFGSGLLAQSGAKEVIGVDLDAASIDLAKQDWPFKNVTFHASSIEAYCEGEGVPFDYILSFETLEHVKDPKTVLCGFKKVLAKDGVLVGSVPSELDALDHNPFHLRIFNRPELEELLANEFAHYEIFGQSFFLQSKLSGFSDTEEVMNSRGVTDTTLSFQSGRETPDTYFFLASDEPLPEIELNLSLSSRAAWELEYRTYQRCQQQLDELSKKFKRLFYEHADLKRRFSNMLGWGNYYYQKVEQKEAPKDYLQEIESAKGKREDDYLTKIQSLQDEMSELKELLEKVQRQPSDREDLINQFKKQNT